MKTNLSLPILSLVIILLGFSCAKKISRPDCANIETINIAQNGPLYEGETLKVSILPISGTNLSYRWTGPKGWTFETTDSVDGIVRTKSNITRAEAGEYKVQIFDKTQGCVQFEGSTTVKVTAVTQPPCNIEANTTTSDNKTLGKYKFKNVKFLLNGKTYSVTANEKANSDQLEMLFAVDGALKPGIYKTKGSTATTATQVGLHIKMGLIDYVAADGQSVYVVKKNDQLEISFCAVKFSSPFDILNPAINISARIVQP